MSILLIVGLVLVVLNMRILTDLILKLMIIAASLTLFAYTLVILSAFGVVLFFPIWCGIHHLDLFKTVNDLVNHGVLDGYSTNR